VDNVKMDLREIAWDDTYWIDVAQDMDQCKALVNTIMNIWAGNFLIAAQLAASQEGLSSKSD
jgi:hypothetical protein